ncbi:ABC transporter ATP-binding protein [Treponema phagedenis]|uniref:ABC transporter ATP-binding protein n=1 Tax=Treponema phagedenis TaxID=162 RepID=UPI0021CC9A48|nr:ABC transporter ATP-binding protein [Treponema phagedenis]
MSKILIKDAVKKYGETVVIQNLSVEIPDGSLFTLLGPSGCGKTTLLRMIAGFNSIEGGSFFFDDVLINDLDPSKRNIGMVFQNYAIFPHLSVEDNVKFGLKQRNLSKEEIQRRADYFLSLMQIEQYRTRMPAQLSGGQQQRVALARALAIHPSVLLMDEPLSNLDAKLRIDMRSVIRRIQREIGITTVYVTHDQEEAMAISDYIAIMKDGKIQHLGTAREIYHRPKNVFVAGFIGRNNIIKTMIKDKHVLLNAVPVMPLPLADQEVQLSIRPEDFSFADEGVPAKILDSTFLGSETHYRVSLCQ